jgi:hypothetical protein
MLTTPSTVGLQAPKQQKAALAALAAFAAAVLVNVSPVEAAPTKNVVCSSNPTAKICLKVTAAALTRPALTSPPRPAPHPPTHPPAPRDPLQNSAK